MAKHSSGNSFKHQSKPRKVQITVYKLVELSQSSKNTTYGTAGKNSQLLHSSSDFARNPRVLQQAVGVEKTSVFYDLKKERLKKAQNTERFERAHSQQPAKRTAPLHPPTARRATTETTIMMMMMTSRTTMRSATIRTAPMSLTAG